MVNAGIKFNIHPHILRRNLGHSSAKKGVRDTAVHGLDILTDSAQQWDQPQALNVAFKKYV